MALVLFVDPDPESLRGTIAELERGGFEVKLARSAAMVPPVSGRAPADLLVLEWTMAGASELLHATEAPVITVSRRPSGIEATVALESGASDYVGKPLDPHVFVARVRAVLRRAGKAHALPSSVPSVLTLGELEIDLRAKNVRCAGRTVTLSRSEFAVLEALATLRGRVMSRKALIARVIGGDASVTSRVIDTHVFTLRRKLGACGRRLQTVRGVGYRLD